MAKSESERVVFNKAVNFVLPSAIPTHLDRSQEYALGDVLVYEKKQHFLMPWRKHRLVFTGVNVAELIDDTNFSSQVTKTVFPVFDDASTNRTFGVDGKLDAEIKYAVAHFGVGVSASENTTVSVDFGKVVRHFNNLPSLFNQQQFSVSTTTTQLFSQHPPPRIHPVIQDALRNNRTIFVITSLYVADKADVSVSFKSRSLDGTNSVSKLKSQATQSTSPTSNQTAATSTTAASTSTTLTTAAATPATSTSQAVQPTAATTTIAEEVALGLSEGPSADLEVSFTSTGTSGW